MDPYTKELVEKDFQIVANYKIFSIPTLIVNEKYRINGAVPTEKLISDLKRIQNTRL